jgi:hypothetical protein
MERPVLPHFQLLFRVQFLFTFWRRSTPTQVPLLRNIQAISTCFVIFPPKISYGFLLGVPLLPRCDHCPTLHPLMAFVVLFFLRQSGRSFIRLLPRSCCLSLQYLKSILHSCLFHSLILDVHPFWVLCTTLSWLYSLRLCLLHSATFAWWIIIP